MALGLVAAATLMLQIIEARIISVISWYHLAFFVISIAMFGLTAGAVFVYLRRDRFRPRAAAHLDEHVQAQSCPLGAVAKQGNLGVRILTAASDKCRR
jgi:hypothetical protein